MCAQRKRVIKMRVIWKKKRAINTEGNRKRHISDKIVKVKVGADTIAACGCGAHFRLVCSLSLVCKDPLPQYTKKARISGLPKFTFPRFPQVTIYQPT